MAVNKLIVIQPVSLCNLNCSYCYVPGRKDPRVMSLETLEKITRVVFNSSVTAADHNNDSLIISWHTGEPLTAGINFYQTALELFKKYNKTQIKCDMSIQTNGTLLNQKWCDFLRDNNFSVGVSIDGPELIHDFYRKDWNGKGSFKRAMRGVELLKKNNIPFANIAVLTDNSLDYPDEMYYFFRDSGFHSVGFNVDEQEGTNITSSYFSEGTQETNPASVRRYREFLSRFFDLWIKDKRPFAVREFDNVIARAALYQKYNYSHAIFATEAIAFANIGISREGDIVTFSPELAAGTPENPNEFVIGNVHEIDSFDELESNENFIKQVKAVSQGVLNCSKTCEHFDLCGGGSPANKWFEKGSFEATETTYCQLTRMEMNDLILSKLTKLSQVDEVIT